MGRGPIARLLVMKVDLVGSIGSSLGGGGAFVCWQTDGAIDSLQTDYSYANQPSVGHTRSGAPPPLFEVFVHPVPEDSTGQTLTDLLQAVQHGCVASFERLYSLTSPRLFGILLRIHPDGAEAEDLLQDVYLKVWCRSAQFEADKGSVMHWLSGIARYSSIDGHRRRGSRPSVYRKSIGDDDDPDPYGGIESSDLQPLDLVIRERRTAAVREGLRLLSNEQRESLMLAYCDGLSHAQIALRLGQPVGTVKSWLRRAYEVLRPALSAHR